MANRILESWTGIPAVTAITRERDKSGNETFVTVRVSMAPEGKYTKSGHETTGKWPHMMMNIVPPEGEVTPT